MRIRNPAERNQPAMFCLLHYWRHLKNLSKSDSQRFHRQKTGPNARKAANELDDYFVQVKQLIETTYVANNNTQVILISCTLLLQKIIGKACMITFFKGTVAPD